MTTTLNKTFTGLGIITTHYGVYRAGIIKAVNNTNAVIHFPSKSEEYNAHYETIDVHNLPCYFFNAEAITTVTEQLTDLATNINGAITAGLEGNEDKYHHYRDLIGHSTLADYIRGLKNALPHYSPNLDTALTQEPTRTKLRNLGAHSPKFF